MTLAPQRPATADMMEMVMPNDSNPLGNILGGKVMHLIDVVGGIAAGRHARRPVVTASMDNLDFHNPIKVGELIVLHAVVTWVGRTSIEVRVDVHSENIVTGEQKPTSTAYLTFVALGDDGKPAEVPPLLLETEEEKGMFKEGEERRRLRMARRNHKR
jgi:acyl-CoA hydrolase